MIDKFRGAIGIWVFDRVNLLLGPLLRFLRPGYLVRRPGVRVVVVVTICDRLAVGAEVVPPGVVVWPEFGVAFRLIVGLLWAYLVHLGLSLASLWVYCGSIWSIWVYLWPHCGSIVGISGPFGSIFGLIVGLLWVYLSVTAEAITVLSNPCVCTLLSDTGASYRSADQSWRAGQCETLTCNNPLEVGSAGALLSGQDQNI